MLEKPGLSWEGYSLPIGEPWQGYDNAIPCLPTVSPTVPPRVARRIYQTVSEPLRKPRRKGSPQKASAVWVLMR